jgi:serine/threonine-protein kinase PBS1
MFRDQKRYPDLIDPLIEDEYPSKGLNQAVAVAAMCLQEEASVRPLMGDVVMAFSFLTTSSNESSSPSSSIVPPLPDQMSITEGDSMDWGSSTSAN